MDHVALDRTGPDDRDLDDEIVKSARLDVRQHRHLRPALDLEGAERVGRADHRIGARIFGRDRREIHRDALMLGEQIKAALHRGEHAEREAVRSEEHTSELQSLMRISYAVFCLKKKKILQYHSKRTNKYKNRDR